MEVIDLYKYGLGLFLDMHQRDVKEFLYLCADQNCVPIGDDRGELWLAVPPPKNGELKPMHKRIKKKLRIPIAGYLIVDENQVGAGINYYFSRYDNKKRGIEDLFVKRTGLSKTL